MGVCSSNDESVSLSGFDVDIVDAVDAVGDSLLDFVDAEALDAGGVTMQRLAKVSSLACMFHTASVSIANACLTPVSGEHISSAESPSNHSELSLSIWRLS